MAEMSEPVKGMITEYRRNMHHNAADAFNMMVKAAKVEPREAEARIVGETMAFLAYLCSRMSAEDRGKFGALCAKTIVEFKR